MRLYARRVIREASGPQVSSPPPVIKYDRSRVAWYWEESPERMGMHSLVKPPHWVRFDPATEDKLESALQCGNAGVMTVPGKYHADIKSMMQKNVNTGFGGASSRSSPEPPRLLLPSRASVRKFPNPERAPCERSVPSARDAGLGARSPGASSRRGHGGLAPRHRQARRITAFHAREIAAKAPLADAFVFLSGWYCSASAR